MESAYRIALLPGDGTGIELGEQTKRLLLAVSERAGIQFDIDEIPCGGQYYLEHGVDWPEDAADRCRDADVILLGAVGWPSPDGTGPVTMTNGKMAGYSPVIGNRIALELYANVRPEAIRRGPGENFWFAQICLGLEECRHGLSPRKYGRVVLRNRWQSGSGRGGSSRHRYEGHHARIF